MPSSRLVVMVALLLGACRGGCRPQASAPARDPTLAQLPAGTRFVASVDIAKVRGTALWTRLSALADENPVDRKRLQQLTARTGLDPLRQIHRIVAAFPDNARQLGQFVLVIDGEGFDEQRLVAYAQSDAAQGATRGAKISARQHGKYNLWTTSGPDRTAGFFVGKTRFVLGAGGWAEEMADLASGGGPSAADNAELEHLVSRINPARALWFAALVPMDLRRMLLDDPARQNAASVTRLAAAADLGPGLTAELVADLSNADDARALVTRIQTTVRESKRNAQVLMLGLGPYLDALAATAEGPRLRVTLTLAEAQVKDLIERAGGLVRLARGKRPR